jgi:hypothetical protein
LTQDNRKNANGIINGTSRKYIARNETDIVVADLLLQKFAPGKKALLDHLRMIIGAAGGPPPGTWQVRSSRTCTFNLASLDPAAGELRDSAVRNGVARR